jgi:broad specificity phosphatase PhoE
MEMQVMAEKTVLIMRHAEKTDDPETQSLAKSGKVRAKRLAKFIPEKFGAPDFIFASAISRHSARPYETMVPLSRKTGVPIDATIADNDYGVLAKTILKKARYDSALTVVCWHHGQIPSMLYYFGAPRDTYSDHWDRNVFNLIFRLKISGSRIESVKQFEQPF